MTKCFASILSLIAPSPADLASGLAASTPESDSQFTLRVAVPPVSIVEHEAAGREVRIDGYGAQPRRPGAPDLP